jgi:uncharacterized protein (DUF4415 family)
MTRVELKELEARATAPTRKEQVRLAKAAAIARAKKFPKRMQEELRALGRIRDEDVDTSDIPELTDEQWEKSKRYIGLHYRPMKRAVTIRLDADLLAWFKAKGSGYQTAINRVLREYFASHR